MWLARPADLKALDASREACPRWFQSQGMLGGVCYVDLFAGNLAGVRARIPYFKELGLTYLHLMPLFKVPMPENDGGYAVSSYREVNPVLGSMAELAGLATELRQEGISLVVDFVFNHTSDEHEWARRALAGDPEHQEYYFMFPDRTMPDAYERNLREIFPEVRRGSFTYRPEVHRWVWTTFNSFQWDLNYANPAVFNRMAEELLFLANQGRGGAAAGRGRLHLEADGHELREPARSAHADSGVQCAGAHRSSGPDVQVGGYRPSRRSGQIHRTRRVPALLQSVADGPAVGVAGHARGPAAQAVHARPLQDQP